jgi:hypothetical protein
MPLGKRSRTLAASANILEICLYLAIYYLYGLLYPCTPQTHSESRSTCYLSGQGLHYKRNQGRWHHMTVTIVILPWVACYISAKSGCVNHVLVVCNHVSHLAYWS